MPQLIVVSDLHYRARPKKKPTGRRGERAADMLRGIVGAVNASPDVDAVLLAGDLLDQGEKPHRDDIVDLARHLRRILDELRSPWLAVPGNHDLPPPAFAEIFGHRRQLDTAGVRVLGLWDQLIPKYDALLTDDDDRRLRDARGDGFTGVVIAMQHVPAIPASLVPFKHKHQQPDRVRDAARAGGVDLILNGHAHHPTPILDDPASGLKWLSLPALCESPDFAYIRLVIRPDESMGRAGFEVQPRSAAAWVSACSAIQSRP